MPRRRGQMPYVENILSREVVEGIMAKEALIRAGEFPAVGALATSSWISPAFVTYRDRLSSTTVECSPNHAIRGCVVSYADVPRQKESLRDYEKVVTQMRDVSPPSSPLILEPVSEAEYDFPKGKVVNIRKGLRLKKRD
jgi:hypothetical protein